MLTLFPFNLNGNYIYFIAKSGHDVSYLLRANVSNPLNPSLDQEYKILVGEDYIESVLLPTRGKLIYYENSKVKITDIKNPESNPISLDVSESHVVLRSCGNDCFYIYDDSGSLKEFDGTGNKTAEYQLKAFFEGCDSRYLFSTINKNYLPVFCKNESENHLLLINLSKQPRIVDKLTINGKVYFDNFNFNGNLMAIHINDRESKTSTVQIFSIEKSGKLKLLKSFNFNQELEFILPTKDYVFAIPRYNKYEILVLNSNNGNLIAEIPLRSYFSSILHLPDGKLLVGERGTVEIIDPFLIH